MILGGEVQSLLEIDVLDKWAPFHSSNGSCDVRLGCKPKGRRTYHWLVFELLFQHLEHKALETIESWLDWVMVQAKLQVVEQYYGTTHGVHFHSQRRCNNVNATMPNPNQPNINS
jgi:hypothetical protein